MTRLRRVRRLAFRAAILTPVVAAAGYVAWAGTAWLRYGHARPATGAAADPLLDRFMPRYDVVERHEIAVSAPAALTLAAAKEADLEGSFIARAIFRTREAVLGARALAPARPRALLPLVESLGWGVLAETPGRELVMGAVTQPWLPDVVFRPLPPDQFASFAEPGFVKIAWTLRSDPIDAGRSIFRTETRAVATDAEARARFRSYWARFSPGIVVIRQLMLAPLKDEAERRARSRRAS